jgi:hypothetical protein
MTKEIHSNHHTPLFVPMKINNGRLGEAAHLETTQIQPQQKFCLMFYPDPEHPPKNDPLTIEYWKSLNPMIICRDMSGYYLGGPEDSHKVFFETMESNMHTPETAVPYIRQAVSNYHESLSYGSPDFSDKQIYLHRYRSG